MPNPVLTRAIDALASRSDLSSAEAEEVLSEIMHGEASEAQIAAFLIALRTKGEVVQELVGLARAMRALATGVPSTRENLLDTAGTGGGLRTFNVSTTATSQPSVNVDCNQNGALVYRHYGFFYGDPSPSQNFVLQSPAWTSGAADCTATLYYIDPTLGVELDLATLPFNVSA